MQKTAPKDIVDYAQWYRAIGIEIGILRGKEYLSKCPECGKPKHWHVNKQTGQHHCKVCSFSGNHYSFMQWMLESGSQSGLSEIAEERGISEKTLQHAEFFKFEEEWYVPIFNDNKLIGLRKVVLKDGKWMMYNLPSASISTKQKPIEGTYLYQLHQAKNNKVMVCEGYWDALALYDSFDKPDKIPFSIWATPSASICRPKWLPRFSNKEVFLSFDCDEAGKKGIQKWTDELREHALETRSIRWPKETPDKFDLRDLAHREKEKTGEVLLEYFEHHQMEAPRPVRTAFAEIIKDLKEGGVKLNQQFIDTFAVALSVAFMSHHDGDPLWMYIVGAPGSGKTLITNSLSQSEHTFHVSKVTATQLVSGRNAEDGSDPSLIPKLNDKTLVMKDYTEIIDMGGGAQADMLGVLRGAYDRTLFRPSGIGIPRHYNSKFAVLAAVTGKIYQTTQASLGERFLKIHLDPVGGKDPTDQINAAMSAARHNPDLGRSASVYVSSYLDYLKESYQLEDLPQFSVSQAAKVAPIVRVVAHLRTAIATGREKEDLEAPPEIETGARTAIQLQKLAWGLSVVLNKKTVDEQIFNILRRVARDTCRGYYQNIIRMCAKDKVGVTIKTLCARLSLTPSPINRKIAVLRQIGVLEPKPIKKNGPGKPEQFWVLTKEFQEIWDKSGIGL